MNNKYCCIFKAVVTGEISDVLHWMSIFLRHPLFLSQAASFFPLYLLRNYSLLTEPDTLKEISRTQRTEQRREKHLVHYEISNKTKLSCGNTTY